MPDVAHQPGLFHMFRDWIAFIFGLGSGIALAALARLMFVFDQPPVTMKQIKAEYDRVSRDGGNREFPRETHHSPAFYDGYTCSWCGRIPTTIDCAILADGSCASSGACIHSVCTAGPWVPK